MDVKLCYRKGCSNTECNTFIPKYGYICDECKQEFKIYLKKKGYDVYKISKGDILAEIFYFKDVKYNSIETTVDDFFNSHHTE